VIQNSKNPDKNAKAVMSRAVKAPSDTAFRPFDLNNLT
jgi:hypothetical protein